MFVVSVLQAASSLAPSDKYHKNPQGNHQHNNTHPSIREGLEEEGGVHSIRNSNNNSTNNNQFSHTNGITSSSGAASNFQDHVDYHRHDGEQYHHHLQQQQNQEEHQQLLPSSPYHFYPATPLESSSITLSSQKYQAHQQPPTLLFKGNRSSSSSSGNGSQVVIDGSYNGSIVEGSDNKYYYYYNGYYYPATVVEEVAVGSGTPSEEQVYALASQGKYTNMGRVGEETYRHPGSPASITGIGAGNGSVHSSNGTGGLFKSKSSSIPVTGSPLARGFRDSFASNMSPAPPHALSAESSPLHRSASATTANNSPTLDKYSSSANNNLSGSAKQEGNKKWSFGGLFRRNKSKSASSSSVAGAHSATPNSTVAASSNNNSIVVVENEIGRGAHNKLNNNNYGNGSPLFVRPVRTFSSPARPASSVGFVSVDPNGGKSTGQSEISRYSIPSSNPKFVNAESQTRAKGKLSESDISTCDSDFELENSHDNPPPEPAPQERNDSNKQSGNNGSNVYKQNFLVRRLSRRKEKAAAKKAAALAAQQQQQQQAQQLTPPRASLATASNHHHHNSNNDFISSQQQHGHLDVPQMMKRRVGSSPDSLNNSSEPWQSWETTKKPQTQLQALQQQHRLLQQNYSSNGSLSLSQEGGYISNNNSINSSNNHASKSSRAAAKEAVKARAIARRESFLNESSTSDEDTEERSQSSLQGSFSSLNSRNRRQKAFNMQQAQFQQQRHLFPATSCASPSSPMPVPLDYRTCVSATASPNMNRRMMMMMGPPGSPKWETRLIYQNQQEAGGIAPQHENSASESNKPVVVRYPRKMAEKSGPTPTSNLGQMSQNNGDQQNFIMATEMISEDQHVVTAGLKVPFVSVQNQQQYHQDQQSLFHNGQLMYPEDPSQYVNVTNGMRGQSSTPYSTMNASATTGASSLSYSNNAMHHASPTPPPPPPPRRAVGPNTNANPNFYRPMSCSYLDSYATQLHQMNEQHHHQLLMRQQSPMIYNGNYIYPRQEETTPVSVMNGIARSSPRRFVHAPTNGSSLGNDNLPDVDNSSNLRHTPLIRSPSEPPVRAEQARISSSPVKRLMSSPMSNGKNSEINSDEGVVNKSVITSKLGFPVRRLQEASKLAGVQGPAHVRASEFWRKKENEVTSPSFAPSPVGSGNLATGNIHQKKYLNRIRSADSSPLPVPKMRKSPGGVVASNESISSLSSFSENAASPGPPKNCSSPINPVGILKHGSSKATPVRAQISKTPNPQQLTYGNSTNNKDKENNNSGIQQQSAMERLKVRIPSAPGGIKTSSSSTNPPHNAITTRNNGESGNNSKTESNNNRIRSLIELNNGKTPGKNLEDALNELEDMYKSLRLSDEDLLSRAERRDLPTQHQELRNAPLIPIPQAYHRFEHVGSVESLGTGSGSSGTNYTFFSGGDSSHHQQQPRVRAPPVRRSARPDTVSDDMANRRLAFPDGKPMDPRLVVAKTGSYLARSPAFSPCTSPCPPDGSQQHGYSHSFFGQDEPDLTFDDVSFRNYKRANSIRVIEPQPPFGIPLGPITAAPATDYLHSKPTENYRPIFGHLKTPDVVNDDIAFRNLRKDLGQEGGLPNNKDWTPRLFSPTQDTKFNYPKVKDGKKLRAIRSLSANITHMSPHQNGGNNSNLRGSPIFLQNQHDGQKIKDDMSKLSSSYSDLNRRSASYLQPSWVEQIEKLQTSTETLTDHRNSSRLSTAILDPPEHWERKFPKNTVELTPPVYDPTKTRRPWTDIILDSFQKEKEKELERIAAEEDAAATAAATVTSTEGEKNANVSSDANNKTRAESELLDGYGDDDVFMEGSKEACKSNTVDTGITQIGQTSNSSNTIKISGNGSKNNDPQSFQQTKPNKDNSGDDDHVQLTKLLPLLPGQKTRRGSWVEPSHSTQQAYFYASPQCIPATAPVVSSSHPSLNPFHQDKRRKSWSDLPKNIDSFSSSNPGPIILSGSSCSASPATGNLFNPLPPPKKVRQINLEAFNNNNNPSSTVSVAENEPTSSTITHEKIVKSNSSSPNDFTSGRQSPTTNPLIQDKEQKRNSRANSSEKVKSTFFPAVHSKSQDDLNELMDQLLRDADSCSQSIRDSSRSPFSRRSLKGRGAKGDKEKSISSTTAVGGGEVAKNTSKKEMNIHTDKVSSEPNNSKQDLSCAIVGIIPKQSSPPPKEMKGTPERNNQGGEQQQPTLASSAVAAGSSKVLKFDNSSSTVVGGSGSKENSNKRGASSIEDLIESINESLPELEASCGGIPVITKSESNTHFLDEKTTGSPSSSIPSPSPGSPIPPVLSVSVKKEGIKSDSSGLSAAFPVPAKRHNLPGKQASDEESIYENLPAMKGESYTPQPAGVKTGNDGKMSSSSPFTAGEENAESYMSSTYYGDGNSARIPPLVTIKPDGSQELTQRARNNDTDDQRPDNEDKEPHHSNNSSSHQPSSLSSNDSSEISGVVSGERRMGVQDVQQQYYNPTNNSTNDNINTTDQDAIKSCSATSSLPSPLPTSSATLNTISSSSDNFSNNSRERSGGNNGNNPAPLTRNSSLSSSGESLLRKKSEGEISSGLSDDEGNLSSSFPSSLLYDWFTRWNGLLLFACYLVAFLQSFATFDFFPGFGIFIAILVFFAYLL